MDTKDLTAIVCIIIAIIILLSLTIYTVVTEWKKISREHAQRQKKSATAAAHSYENTECFKHEYTACDKITSDRCQTADSSDRMATAGAHGGQLTGENVLLHVETEVTSF